LIYKIKENTTCDSANYKYYSMETITFFINKFKEFNVIGH